MRVRVCAGATVPYQAPLLWVMPFMLPLLNHTPLPSLVRAVPYER